MAHFDPKMQECIENCLACYRVCLSTAMSHCLEAGGEHTKPPHFRLMMACAENLQGRGALHAARHTSP